MSANIIYAALGLIALVLAILWQRNSKQLRQAQSDLEQVQEESRQRQLELEQTRRDLAGTQQGLSGLKDRFAGVVDADEEEGRVRAATEEAARQLEALRASYLEKKAVYDSLLHKIAIFDERLAFAEMGRLRATLRLHRQRGIQGSKSLPFVRTRRLWSRPRRPFTARPVGPSMVVKRRVRR